MRTTGSFLVACDVILVEVDAVLDHSICVAHSLNPSLGQKNDVVAVHEKRRHRQFRRCAVRFPCPRSNLGRL